MTHLDTERLTIREFVDADLRPLLRILSDPSVMEFSVSGPMDEPAVRRFLASCRESYRDHGYGQWALVERGSRRVLGFCGLSRVELNGRREVEIGYRLAGDCWGKGLASEAGAEVLECGFARWQLDSVVAIIAKSHVASLRVADKLGLAFDCAAVYQGWDVAVYRGCRVPEERNPASD